MNTRPSLRHGLPYGWWKSGDFWAGVITLMTFALLGLIIGAWFVDLKAWW